MIVRDKYSGTTVLRLGDNLDSDQELEFVAESDSSQCGIVLYLDRGQLERLQRHITYVLGKANG